MNRYVLTFYKKNNMRFLSHLDLQNLFRRALYKAHIDIAFTQGFNPHAKINIVQPLSLGFETERDYFEFDTNTPVDGKEVLKSLNSSMPGDIRFFEFAEEPVEKQNLSAHSTKAEYSIIVRTANPKLPDVDSFMSLDKIMILKRDKKTKTMVEKDIKFMDFSISDVKPLDNFPISMDSKDAGCGFSMKLLVPCASNETLNPLQLTESLLKFSGIDYLKENIRVTRTELYFDNR